MKIPKNRFDRFMDEILKLVTNECYIIKENIDVDKDGFVDTNECKIIIKSIIKGFKKGLRLIK